MQFPRIKKRQYFDAGSYTPLSKSAYRIMQKIFALQVAGKAGNPQARHQEGRVAQEYLEAAYQRIARCHQIKKEAVIGTSGATEANFIAIRTALLHARAQGMHFSEMHMIVGAEEHSSIYRDVEYCKTLGLECTMALPERGKRYTPKDVVKHFRKNTMLLSLQYVNSQHGTIQPIAQIADAARKQNPRIVIHTDAAQATAYFDCAPSTLRSDMVTIDSAKTFGPQGAGALLLQKAGKYPGLQGEHTAQDIRPGTPATALFCGFAEALHETVKQRKELREEVKNTRNYLAEKLQEVDQKTYIHGIEKHVEDIQEKDWETVAPHLIYSSFPDTNHAYLAALLDADGYAVATGSACDEENEEGMRIGVLPGTKKQQIHSLITRLKDRKNLAKKG